MMKKNVMLIIGLLLSFSAMQASEMLIVRSADNAPKSIELDDIRHISFASNQMLITSLDGTVVYFVLDGLTFTFNETNLEITDLPTINIAELSVYITSQGEVIIIGDVEILSLVVYDINGRRMLTSNTDNLNVSVLPTGVFLLNIKTPQGFFTQRFIKQ